MRHLHQLLQQLRPSFVQSWAHHPGPWTALFQGLPGHAAAHGDSYQRCLHSSVPSHASDSKDEATNTPSSSDQGHASSTTPSSGTPTTRLRSLAEIFQEDVHKAAVDMSTLQAVTSGTQEGAASEGSGSLGAVQPRPGDGLISQQFGYAAISGALPSSSTTAALRGRLHPKRLFVPGQTYQPEELNPFGPKSSTPRKRFVPSPPSQLEVQALADYKNVAFIERFLSPAGKLVPRNVSRLPAPVHKRVVREIKRARHMAFIPGEARPEKRHLRALRESEELQRMAAAS